MSKKDLNILENNKYLMMVGVYIKDIRLYHQVIEEIKRRKLDYIEIFPGEDDKDLIVLTDSPGIFKRYVIVVEAQSAVRSVIPRLYGKEKFHEIHIGIDPGMRVGVAVYGDGIFLEELELTDTYDLRRKIEEIVRGYGSRNVVLRIGKGDEPNRNRIINILFGLYPIEIVDEYGTTSIKNRNTEAAKKIAMKRGKPVKGRMEIRARRGEISEVQRKSRIASNNLVTISRELARRVVKGEIDLEEAIEMQKKN
ncbi:MAG: hypothetical protein C0180_02450 [Aciduliprofundum sp.]|jgi:hypothetical protein|nr:MAG: hypothetical protein C0180_02450 [Aciduliprofundum sp.]